MIIDRQKKIISLDKKSVQIQAKSCDFILKPKNSYSHGCPEATTLESATCIIKAFNARILM